MFVCLFVCLFDSFNFYLIGLILGSIYTRDGSFVKTNHLSSINTRDGSSVCDELGQRTVLRLIICLCLNTGFQTDYPSIRIIYGNSSVKASYRDIVRLEG